MSPKVSVIICTYNRAEYLPVAIKSVLAQTFNDYEIIIVDDASNDNTENLVKPYMVEKSNIKYYKNEQNLGISKSRNKAVNLATGEYIAMLDSDDYWTDKNKLQKQTDILEKDSSIGLVGSSILTVRKNKSKIKEIFYNTNDKDIRENILVKNQFAQSSILFRKNIFTEVGGYNENYEVAEDLDLWLRIGKKYKFANLKETTVAYMMHSAGISKIKRKKMAKTIDEIIEKNKNNYPNYWKAKIISFFRILRSNL